MAATNISGPKATLNSYGFMGTLKSEAEARKAAAAAAEYWAKHKLNVHVERTANGQWYFGPKDSARAAEILRAEAPPSPAQKDGAEAPPARAKGKGKGREAPPAPPSPSPATGKPPSPAPSPAKSEGETTKGKGKAEAPPAPSPAPRKARGQEDTKAKAEAPPTAKAEAIMTVAELKAAAGNAGKILFHAAWGVVAIIDFELSKETALSIIGMLDKDAMPKTTNIGKVFGWIKGGVLHLGDWRDE